LRASHFVQLTRILSGIGIRLSFHGRRNFQTVVSHGQWLDL
jgi:hypothetical protein